MSKEEALLDEEGEGGHEFGPSPQGPARGPTEPVATELIVGGHGAPGVGFLKSRRVRMMMVGLLVAALVVAGLQALMPKGVKGETLALKFEPGQMNRYRALMFFDGTRVLPKGKQQNFRMTMGATVDTKVASVDASGATVDVTISNFALHSGTPALDVVPSTIHGQMVINSNGSVTSGGLGLSAAVASKMIPGWDVFVPILPTGTVVPGATWNTSTDEAFAGSETVHVSADSALLSYLASGSSSIAVVTSKMVIPVDQTISIQAMADALGVGVDQIGFPEGSDPQFVYKGQINLDTMARVDGSSGKVVSTYSRGTATYTETITDWPPTLPEVPSGEVQTSISFSMRLKQQPLDQPTPAKPEQSAGAKSSPASNGAG